MARERNSRINVLQSICFNHKKSLRSKGGLRLSNLQKTVYELSSNFRIMFQYEMAKTLNVSLSTAHNDIKRLKESGHTQCTVKKPDRGVH